MDAHLRQLRHLVAVVEAGNYAKAAERLSITQPSLSRSVQALERRIGARLLDRGRRGVVLTQIGQAALQHARTLIKQAELASRELALLVGRSAGHVTIGAGPYAAWISVGTAVGRFATSHPGISVSVRVGDWDQITRDVLAAEIDLAIVDISSAEVDRRLALQRLPERPVRYFCRAGHPLARVTSPSLDDLDQYPLATAALPKRLGHLRTPRPTHASVGADVPWLHVNTFEMSRHIVLASDALGFATDAQIAQDVEAGLLVAFDVAVRGLHTSYGIIRLAERSMSPAAKSLMQAVIEAEQGNLITTPAITRKRRRRSRYETARGS